MAFTTSRNRYWLVLLISSLSLVIRTSTCLAQEIKTGGVEVSTITSMAPNSYTTSAARTNPTQTHTIQAGLGDHKFNPDVTVAEIGDTIEFRFYPTNHSVVRAEYGYPCIPYEMMQSTNEGFFSGFHPVEKVLDDAPKYQIRINDTDPVFFYCSAPGSCISYGMVGVINPTTSTPLSRQQELARNSSYMLNPGERFPSESLPPSASPSLVTIPPGSHTAKKGLSAGIVAGIVIASSLAVTLAALLFFFWGRTKSLKDVLDSTKTSAAWRVAPATNTIAAMEASPPSTSTQAGQNNFLQSYTPSATFPPNHHALSPIHSPSLSFPFNSPSLHPSTAETIPLPLSPLGDSLSTHSHYHHHHRPHHPYSSVPPAPPFPVLDGKLGPYGMQRLNDSAPSYYDAVCRTVREPVEMEGTTPVANLMGPTRPTTRGEDNGEGCSM